MQTRPRHAVRTLFVLLSTAALLVTGCSSSSEQSAQDLPDAATLLQESSQTTRNQQSVHLELKVDGQIEELPIESLTGDLTTTPAVAAKGTANIVFMGQRLEGVDFVIADGNLYGAITAGSFQDFGPAVDIYDVSAILNPDRGLANLLANFANPTVEGTESINGVETARITGDVSAEAVNGIAPQIGATGPVPGTAWIATDGEHKLVQAQLDPSPDTSITMTLSEWGKPVSVDKPAV